MEQPQSQGIVAAIRRLLGWRDGDGVSSGDLPEPSPAAMWSEPQDASPQPGPLAPPHSRPAASSRPRPTTGATGDSGVYRRRDELLTPAEGAFYRALRVAAGDRWHIAAKVRLADLVAPPGGREWQAAWNRIAAKHVDFVLCEPATLRPCLAIELDDRSHRRPDRVERDAFVDRVFADAALPILHIPVRRAYDAQTLASQITASLGVSPVPDTSNEEGRRCERCGGEMRKRVARRGQHVGDEFWGCTNFPRCRHIVPLSG